MDAGISLKKSYIYWWQQRKGYRWVSLWIAALNAGIGLCLLAAGEGSRGDMPIGTAGCIGLWGAALILLGIRAAVKIKLMYAIRDRMNGLPDIKAGLLKTWVRYLSGYVLMIVPALIIPTTIWYEAPLCIILLWWRMHFVPYTAVLEPDRTISRNGIRRGQGAVWQICLTAFCTKWIFASVFGFTAWSLWLASMYGWLMAALLGWAAMSAVVEPLYQTGNLLLYKRQYLDQVQPRTFWMDMKEGQEEGQIGDMV